MGLYLTPPISRSEWLKPHASNLRQLGGDVFPFQARADHVLLAYVASPIEAIAVMFSKKELDRYLLGRPDARYYAVPKALVEDLLGEKL